jgi:MFS transporter, AAHS family, 4-hydroxybenzoate transporter
MSKVVVLEDVVDRQRFNPVRVAVIVLCFLVMFFDGYELNLIGYVGPALISHFSISKAAFGPVISAGLAGFMLGALMLGDLGDRFGRKRVIIAGTILFGALTLIAAWSSSLGIFIALRFVAGLGLGGAVPNAVALNAEFAPARVRATTIGVMFVGYTLGGAAPGWAAAVLLKEFGWRSVFYLGSCLPLLIAATMIFILPESVRFLAANKRIKELRILLAKMQDEPLPVGDFEILSNEVKAPGSPSLQLFKDGRGPDTLFLWFAFVSCLTSILFVMAWSPTLVAGLGIDPGRAALIGAMWQTGGAIGSLLITRLLDRFGILTIAFSVLLAIPLVILIGRVGTSETVLMIVILIGGLLGSGGQVGLNAIAGTIYPTMIRSTGVGWAFGMGRVGAILGPLIGGSLVAAGLDVRNLYVVMSLPFALTALSVALLFFRGTKRARLVDALTG